MENERRLFEHPNGVTPEWCRPEKEERVQHKRKWWLLFAIFPLSVGLLWFDGRLTLQPQGHQLLEMGIVLLSFGLMALWVRADQTEISRESATHTTYLVLPDPECNQALDLPVADWHNSLHSDADERTLVDFKGKYN